MKLTSIAILIAVAATASAQTPKPKTAAPTKAPSAATASKATTTPKAKPQPKANTAAPAKSAPKVATAPAAKSPAKVQAAKPAAAAVKTSAPAKSATATVKASAPAKPATATVKASGPAKPAAKPTTTPAANTASTKPAEVKKPEAAPEIARTGRRDPFISPVRLAEERMRSNPACTTGARCLVISQVILKGVVKTQNGMIAMVENGARKQYNLHEKDIVQNGSVLKITGDSVVFQETTTDPLGRPVTKEVVKRVTVPAV
jgi:Tfp pilus assembly protein PilP